MSRVMDWEGQAGESWAAEWRRTDRSWGGLTERLLRGTRDFSFSSVLDIGCGAGELSLAIARGRHGVSVLGVDISPRLVDVARERGHNLANASFELGDASRWVPPAGFRPDLLISRHGVMFFPDPVGAFSHLANISAPGAGLLFSCFRSPAVNEIFTAVGSLLPPPETPPDPEAPGPMAFADPDRVRTILTSAGWTNVKLEPFDFAMVVGMGEDAVSDAAAYFSTIGPTALAMAAMSEEDRVAFRQRLRGFLASREIDGIVAFSAGAWIVTAHRR
ncbi:class I SAM-dependent methyltransferase [Altererythrobacter sp. CC-YST694]|uniref:class I SAM-dependent methyltransferase n=1 Tax=Altererythrobacter sp. CC-YST694 TaxID=2755038 RepID=UPI001D02B624|nr:class I SAM-dependent methyltransferase [Altererythrobacter sp. CC-YST694]MCB5424218.1 class I SAM-dependent methyltransferase [Altererythrobacter sp. CC-YST694]